MLKQICKNLVHRKMCTLLTTAGIAVGVAMIVTLGALWALVPAGLAACLLVIRTALEDKTLQAELDGYKDYAARVRYRLLPGVW